MSLLNFANACFNAGATCSLHRNLSWNGCERGKSQDRSPTKTGFSTSSKWSHLQLLQSKGSLKNKAAWCSHFYLTAPCWNHVYWFAFSPLDTTSTHLWPKLAPTEHKGGLCWFSRLFPTAGSSLCQFLLPAWYWQVTQIPLFQISTFSRRAVKTAPTRWLISKTLLQLQLLQLWFLSELINRSLCTVETFNFTEILSSHL